MSYLTDIFYFTRQKLIQIEKFIAGTSLLLLLILAITQVILRNFFELGFSNIDVVSRHLVLFVTFMGAALASESSQHIKIDCINSLLKPSIKETLKIPLLVISAFICAAFFWYALQFWLDEKLYAPDNEKLALYLALIIPVGFFTLSLHFLLLSLTTNKQEKQT
ncbi:MAG: TRAP transporter small permease [Gammaproteobacteria bacterium]|nr:TRAP transporter small permease [Gammaproteobacteria bacterium]